MATFNNRLKKLTVLWLAVSIGIFMVACGSKKSKSVRQSTPTQTAPTRTEQQERTTPPRPEDQANIPRDTQDTENGNQSGQSDQADQAAPVPAAASGNARTQSHEQAPAAAQSRIQLTLLEERDLSPADRARLAHPVVDRYDANLGGLVYTGSASDTFIYELKAKLAQVEDANQRAHDQEFAKEIGLVQVHHNRPAGYITITALLERNGKREHYNLVGRMNQNLTARAGDATKAPYITADLRCMDRNNGCQNMILKFVDHKQANVKRTSYVVARSTPAWQFISYRAPHLSKNKEYERLVTILTNTRARWLGQRSTSINTVTEIILNTSETVNGSATFVAGLQVSVGGSYNPYNYEYQKITWAGPLVSTENNASFDVTASVDYLPRNLSASKPVLDQNIPYMTDFIKETRLIGNDAKGKITLAVTIRANEPDAQEETFKIEFNRQHRPVHYLGLQEL